MNAERVMFFDDVKIGDSLIYESDSEFQQDAERGKVIFASANSFVVEWEETPSNPVTYYRQEDAMLDWALYKVLND